MRVMKILLCGLLMAMPVFAEETEDRQTATSLHYVSHELDTRQDKLSTGTNAALTYTNSAGDIEQRTVKSDLTGGTTDTSLPQVNAVNAGLNQKQNDITTIDDHTAVTYTNSVGTIGQKGIYQTDGTYAEQSDNLIDAKTFNAALKNGLDSEFVCGGTKPGTDTCWLWQIHNDTLPYVSAVGTVTQDGTPTPENPIAPVFYHQGNMILRKVGNVTDSYDATTHKITRRIGVKVLDGTEAWQRDASDIYIPKEVLFGYDIPRNTTFITTHFANSYGVTGFGIGNGTFYMKNTLWASAAAFKSYLAEQYAAGTPVTVYYPLATPVEEDWNGETIYIPQNQQ